jgi:hypothetical protein
VKHIVKPPLTQPFNAPVVVWVPGFCTEIRAPDPEQKGSMGCADAGGENLDFDREHG